MDFALFLLVNAALFIRPGEILPSLAGLPIYQVLILLSLAAASPKLIAQWTARPISERPVTICMFGLLGSVLLSHLARFDFGLASYWGMDFARVVVYYLILVAVVDSPARLSSFLTWLLIFVIAMTLLSLGQFHGLVDIPTLKVLERSEEDPATGDLVYILQLVGTGIFNDPNDYCLILTFGFLIAIYRCNDRRSGPGRIFWAIPAGVLLYALILTQSRGGLLALVAGLMTYLASMLGMRRTLIAGALAIPPAFTMIGGRLARMSTDADTAQERMRLWQDALGQFRRSPFFGIGANTLADEIGLVAHNSYVHAYAEIGFFGGTCFLGVLCFSALILRRTGLPGSGIEDLELRRVRPYLMAMLAAYGVGLYSLTRCYVASTYIPMALIEVYQGLATNRAPESRVKFDNRHVLALTLASIGCLVAISTFIRILVH